MSDRRISCPRASATPQAGLTKFVGTFGGCLRRYLRHHLALAGFPELTSARLPVSVGRLWPVTGDTPDGTGDEPRVGVVQAAVADSNDLVDDAWAKKAAAELTTD